MSGTHAATDYANAEDGKDRWFLVLKLRAGEEEGTTDPRINKRCGTREYAH